MNMEPGSLIKICGDKLGGGVYVGIDTDDLFWVDSGTYGVVVGPYGEAEEQAMPHGGTRLRPSFTVLIGGRQGWLWDDEFEAIDEAR